MKIAIFAAGTGGHIYPALSIAENFKKDEVLFFASNRELEKQIYAASDFKVIHLKVSGFRGKSILEKIFFPINLLINVFKVIFELIKFKPAKSLLMGGYISVLGLIANTILFKPIFLHEQNSVMGSANKMASPFTKKNFTSFPIGVKNEKVMGNPIRGDFCNQNYSNQLTKTKVLVLGGSQGCKFFNDNLPAILQSSEIQERIIFQTGNHSFMENNHKIEFKKFIDDIPELFNETKFVICRSGAGTITELQAYGMPAILFPLPNSIDDHQKNNALIYVEGNDDYIFDEYNFDPKHFLQKLNEFNSLDLKELSKKVKKDLHCKAALNIANEIKQN
jgi:UDP-N-acetylglucosamine--N-acetylmuramyl-(pentapeptide) pyrophosphoryl-undecaprenol N-acetylglucosamine transferase